MNNFKIVTGGQSGVDGAALDVAIEFGIEYEGWCPQGGLAEDFPVPPGLLTSYPKLKETPLAEVNQRTEWNVRDSDATLILTSSRGKFEGTISPSRALRSSNGSTWRLILTAGAI